MWKEKIKHRKEKKRKRTQKGEGKNFILPIGGKREILELIFNAINCLKKHNNLSCSFWGNLVLEKMCW